MWNSQDACTQHLWDKNYCRKTQWWKEQINNTVALSKKIPPITPVSWEWVGVGCESKDSEKNVLSISCDIETTFTEPFENMKGNS